MAATTRERSDERRLAAYLRCRTERDGEFYFKSKFVADEVGLSPKRIGQLMGKLADDLDGIEIEPWSYTNATTWRVAPAGRS
ncbi:MAG: hypothetical protein V5A23_06655 [Halobacteriales archaeon]